jgi:YD repeat-containing protein
MMVDETRELMPPMTRQAFEAACTRLDALLSPVSFQFAREVYDYNAFGSASATWDRRGEEVTLVWDGREQRLGIHSSVSGVWTDKPLVGTDNLKGVVDATVAEVGRRMSPD